MFLSMLSFAIHMRAILLEALINLSCVEITLFFTITATAPSDQWVNKFTKHRA